MFGDAPRAIRAAVVVITANWLVFIFVAVVTGGTALFGEITDGQYLIRRGFYAPATEVSRGSWVCSLTYGFATVGATFPAIALLWVYQRPRAARDARDVAVILLALVWFGWSLLLFVPRAITWVGS